jgi:hypothetical protein
MKRTIIVIAIPSFLCSEGRAGQVHHALHVGTQVPLQYAVGHECRFADRFAANIKTGILAYPHDDAIFGILHGRRFRLRNSSLELALEFGASESFGSRSVFESNRPRLDATEKVRALYAALSEDMKSAYHEYVCLPTIAFCLVWNLK